MVDQRKCTINALRIRPSGDELQEEKDNVVTLRISHSHPRKETLLCLGTGSFRWFDRWDGYLAILSQSKSSRCAHQLSFNIDLWSFNLWSVFQSHSKTITTVRPVRASLELPSRSVQHWTSLPLRCADEDQYCQGFVTDGYASRWALGERRVLSHSLSLTARCTSYVVIWLIYCCIWVKSMDSPMRMVFKISIKSMVKKKSWWKKAPIKDTATMGMMLTVNQPTGFSLMTTKRTAMAWWPMVFIH